MAAATQSMTIKPTAPMVRQRLAGQPIQQRASSRRQFRAQRMQPQALFTKNKKGGGAKGYDPKATEVDPATPAFTRRREIFAGRLAMFGFSAALIGEISTGKGILGQVALESGLPQSYVEIGLAVLLLYNIVQGLRPGSPTFSEENQRDVRKRPKGGVQDPNINALSNPKDFFGITEFGFSKNNEVFVGRVAMLGFLAAVIGEKVTGKGPLTQFGIETGVPLSQVGVGLLAFIAFFFLAAVFEGNFGFSNKSKEGNEY